MKFFSVFPMVAFISVAFGASTHLRSPNVQGPAPPQEVDINLSASLLSTTFGIFGNASANQQIAESASGDNIVPATLVSTSGVQADLQQNGEIEELVQADPIEGSSATLNDVFVQSVAAAEDELQANLVGANGASAEHSGDTYIFGGGYSLGDANTSNNLNSRKQ